MYSKFWPKGGLPGILHHYTESLVAFEYTTNKIRKPHSIVFIGGLGDGLATTSYTADLVAALESTGWSLFTLNMTSSYQAWGLGHLDRDTNEIARCVQYVKDYKTTRFGEGKIVLMGHSTGSQHVLHYLHRPNPHTCIPAFDSGLEHINRLVIDGAIMQAPVSDREAIQYVLREGWLGKSSSEVRAVYEQLKTMAEEAVKDGQPYDTILPIFMTSQIGYPSNTPLSCRRFLSLVSPDSLRSPQEDDLFSSDLSDERLNATFGMIGSRGLLRHKLLVLPSGSDQSVPDWVDKEALLSRWARATDRTKGSQIWDKDLSGPIPGASHALSNDDQADPRSYLTRTLLAYLQNLEQL